MRRRYLSNPDKNFRRTTVLTSSAQQRKEALEYEIPPLLDHTNEMQPMGQVSTIKGFFQLCVKVLNDPSSVKIL
jgi:hypothetical protein